MGSVPWRIVYGGIGLIGLAVTLNGLRFILAGIVVWRTDLDTVADAEDGGRVDLQGTAAVHEETISAPVTDRECLGYRKTTRSTSAHQVPRVVPFLLECEDGTVLVRDADPHVDVRDDHSEKRINTNVTFNRGAAAQQEWLLLPGETAYVSGTARAPTEVDAEVPPGVSAVVDHPRTDGSHGRLRDRLSPSSFVVSDAPKGGFASRQVRRGAKLFFAGVAVPAVAIFLLRRFVAPAV